jgi:transposase
MAYLRKMKNREGKIYLSMVEGYRKDGKVYQRVLKNFGRLDILEQSDTNAWETCKFIVEEYNSNKNQMISKSISVSQPLSSPAKTLGAMPLESIYNSLGLSKHLKSYDKQQRYKYSLDEVLKVLVFGRIIDPCSKSKTIEDFQKTLFGNWNVTQNQMDRGLDHLDKIKDDVQFLVHKAITKNIGRSATLVFYDVTNYYFEIDTNDLDEVDENENVVKQGLRKRGPSKEHRPKPIVQMGLFMDSNSIPIAYKLFRGNFTDPVTYIPAIEQVKKQFGIERIVTVADKAMNSTTNILDSFTKGDGWLFSQKFRGQRGVSKELQEFVLSRNDWEFNATETFAKKSILRTRVLRKGTKKLKEIAVREKVVVTWRKAYADRESIRREGAVEYADKLTNSQILRMVCKKGGGKYLDLVVVDENGELKTYSPQATINQKLIDFEAQFDGINVLITSETSMSDDEVIKAYAELNRIEDCFRVTKTELQARPVFVWTKEHIEAHFLTCFLALVLIRLLQHATRNKYSPACLITALRSLKAKEFGQGYYQVEANEDAVSILDIFGVKWNREIQSINIINSLSKTIRPQR